MRFWRVAVVLAVVPACTQIAGIGDPFTVVPDAAPVDAGPDATLIPPLVQLAYVKASNPGMGDEFGWAVALSGDGQTLAVGARYEDSNADTVNGLQSDEMAADAGAVYVFRRTAGAWTQQAYIKAFNSDAGDTFGFSVALSDDGNTLAVGAPFEDSSGTGPGGANNNLAMNAGAAYVFVRSGTVWTQQVYLKASNTQTLDQFGYWVGLSGDGNTLGVGAIEEDSSTTMINGSQADNGALESGALYMFVRAGTVWSQQAYIKPSNTKAGQFFGGAQLSRDGNTVVVSSAREPSAAMGVNGNQTDSSAMGAGACYVFARTGTVWSQQAYLKASNTSASDEFCRYADLSADGNTLVAGSPGEDSSTAGINGVPNEGLPASGAIYVFVRSGTTWTQQAFIKSSEPGDTDELGFRVAMTPDGNGIVAGVYGEDGGGFGVDPAHTEDLSAAGAAYYFVREGTTWTQRHYLKASIPGMTDHFGFPAAGTGVFAIGASGEDGASAGVNNSQTSESMPNAGAVYVFE